MNVNPLYTPRELEHQLNDAGCETIVIFSGSTPTLAEVLGKTGIKTVITVAPGDGTGAALPSPPVDARLTGAIALADALKEGAGLTRTPVAMTGDDLIFLQYTGGTTGLSKGAALTHRNLVANTEQFKAMMPDALRPGQEVVVTAIPLYHIFALMVNFLTYFSVGADNWLVANPRDMDGFVETFKKAKPTVFMGVNTLYAGLTHAPEAARGRFLAPAPVRGRRRRRGRRHVGPLEGDHRPVHPRRLWPVGNLARAVVQPGVDPGVLRHHRPAGARHRHPAARRRRHRGRPRRVRRDLRQGPAGDARLLGEARGQRRRLHARRLFPHRRRRRVSTPEGFLKIVDRKKDMVLVSGFNVYPNEIEAVATACPGVAECACIGVPDDKTGEAVKLFVVKAPGATLTADDVIAHCRKELTAYKVPKIVVFIDALPKSTVGKILRRDLRTVA